MAKLKHRAISLLKILTKIFIGIELSWLILANLVLSTETGAQWINFKPDKFSIQWERAWTFYPAHLHATGLTINIHTWTSDTEITVDHGEGDIRILPLLGKSLLIDNISIDSATASVNYQQQSIPRPNNKPPSGFSLELRNLHVKDFEQMVWNQTKIYGGEAHTYGSIQIKFRDYAQISGVEAVWKDAIISLNDDILGESLTLRFNGGLERFNPRVEKGLELLKKLSGKLVIKGTTASLLPLKLLFPNYQWIEKIDGQGIVDATVVTENGNLLPGTKIDVIATDLELKFLGFRASGSGKVHTKVEGTTDGTKTEINLAFNNYKLHRIGKAQPLLIGRGLTLAANAAEIGLNNDIEELKKFSLILDIPDSEVPDIAFLGKGLPDALGLSIHQGQAFFDGKLEVSGAEEFAQGEFSLTGKNLKGQFRNMNFAMDMALDSRLSGKDLDNSTIELAGTEFRLYNGVFENQSVAVDDAWWMTIAVPDGRVNFTEPMNVDADINLSMKDTRAIIALFSEIKDWLKHFDKFLTVNDVHGSAELSAADQHVSIGDLNLEGDRLQFMAELDLKESISNGIAWGKLGVLSLGVERIDNESNWKFINGRRWFERKRTEYRAD